MDAERWQKIDYVLRQALELEEEQRLRFVIAACGQDDELKREVEAYLEAFHQQNDFLSQPAVEIAARIIAEAKPTRENPALSDTPIGEPPSNPISAFTPPKPIHLSPGVLLDNRYEIERELGRGGMGVVFLAKDQKLSSRQVVVKLLLEKYLNDSDQQSIGRWLKQKFNDEKNALARLRHPGIVHPTDAGELPNGQAYLVMEYVPGKPLRREILPAGMEMRRAAKLIHQIAQALSAAHEAGVIHRDLKPENILLLNVDGEEQIRLIDFGIASVRDEMSIGALRTTLVAGTGAYMSPEQLRGKPEAASDIYALGVIAYELVTGRRPFNAASLTHLGELQREGIKVKPRDLRSDLPETAETAILKALNFNPADRHQDAREFANQFRQAIETVDSLKTNISVLPLEEYPIKPASDASPTHRFPSRRRFLIPAAALLVMMLAGVWAWLGLDFDQVGNRNNQPINAPTPLSAAAERTLSYSFWLRRAARPHNVKPVLPRDLIGRTGDELRINVSSPQAGHLYIFNEWQTQPLKFDVMFPSGRSAELQAGQVVQIPPPSGNPEKDWFTFKPEGDTDKFWLIWSAHNVPELDAVLGWVSQKDKGEIKYSRQIETIRRFIAEHSANAVTVETDELTKQTKLTAKGQALIGLIKLK